MKHMVFALLVFWGTYSAIYATETMLQGLLVSIEKYDLAPLDYAENDVMKLANLLMTRYNGVAQACIDTPNNERGGDAPMKAVMEKIELWCKSLKNSDTAVLYLAGHGVRDADGKLYLAMINFDTKNFDTAAIPLAWIRDRFGEAKGKNKLLLLDTCFAGTAKSVDFAQASSAESGAAFAEAKDVVVIASSRENEKSWLWGDAKHSLFTYWVIEAFKGHADFNNDRTVTCDEIVRYLQTNVPLIAKIVLNKDQHPVVLNAEAGKDFKLPLRASSPERLINDMAEQIDLLMRIGNYPRLAVPEFVSGESGKFEPKYGALPRWASDELRKAVVQASRINRSSYSVLSENATRRLMQSRGLTPDDLGTEKSRELKIEGKEVPLLIDGRLTLFGNGSVALRSVLLHTEEESEVGNVGGIAMLNAAELGMTETSGVFASTHSVLPPRPEAELVSMQGVGLVDPQQRREVVEVLENREKPHPMADPNSPFKVRFEVRPMNRPNAAYVERKVVVDGNECFLPLSKGEEYRIMVKCETEHEVFMRVLVDGLNTLSQPETIKAKDIVIEAVDPKNEGEHVIMPRASLDSARPWVMPPKQERAIQGFYDANSRASTLQRFQVVDADESVAARKNYTEQLGLITIGFFKPVNPLGERRIGTGAGRRETVRIERYTGGNVPGPMMAVYNIRYLTPETLKKFSK